MPRVTPERTQRLKISGMKCLQCVNTIERTLRDLSGVDHVEVNLDEGVATIAGEVEPEDLIRALSYTDYQAEPLTENRHGP